MFSQFVERARDWADTVAHSNSPVVDELTEATAWLPNGYELFAREDIYASGLLLIKEGATVSMQQLPKLIRHGAKPQQFVLKGHPQQANHTDETDDLEPFGLHAVGQPAASAGTTIPEPLVSGASGSSWLTSCAEIVIVDTQESHLKRLINTLTLSGVRMNHIHCTHSPDNLIAFLRRFRPAMLVVDEHSHPLTSMVPKLNTLKRTFNLEHIVVTIDPDNNSQDETGAFNRAEQLQRLADAGVDLVTKPVNRLALTNLIQCYKTKQALQHQLNLAAND